MTHSQKYAATGNCNKHSVDCTVHVLWIMPVGKVL